MIGKGSETALLTESDIRQICAEGFEQKKLDGKKVLAIIPDQTRTAPIDVMFRVVYELLADRVAALDFLVALGTHPPMSDEQINERVGITQDDRTARYPKARFFNHHWKDPNQLCHIGTITAEEIGRISGGLMCTPVKVTINKIVFDYDVLLIIGPTFPHEVVGFSGGNKYLFPGIAGQEIIDMFHWLGALITSPVIIGTKETPLRQVVDRAAGFLPMERLCLSLVVKGTGLAGLYFGTPEEAFSAAADLSEKLHITYVDRPFDKVLSCAPRMYDDLWTGAKCMYKLEPVVADGGELIIYAPHITEVSVTHGEIIRRIGYHVRDYFLKQMDRFQSIPGGVMAHSTHVRGIGMFEDGVEIARIHVVLATRIPREICREIGLGYCDPDSIRIDEWKNREDQGILYVPKAGEMLYRLKKDPFKATEIVRG
ncbi:MAG TPA: lactate racemase domain-containing protein [Acidobacteriota bacterium]|mgnify:FL=1|nr:lactate racemase domain-containing protein [Acidobacteriota bacterium]